MLYIRIKYYKINYLFYFVSNCVSEVDLKWYKVLIDFNIVFFVYMIFSFYYIIKYIVIWYFPCQWWIDLFERSPWNTFDLWKLMLWGVCCIFKLAELLIFNNVHSYFIALCGYIIFLCLYVFNLSIF